MRVRGRDGKEYEVPDHIFGDRDGRTFSRAHDKLRLDRQAGLVWIYMSTHEWVTPDEVKQAVGYRHDSSITARFRDFRKPAFGGYIVDRRYVGGGVHEYRLRDPEEDDPWPASPCSPTSTPPRALTVVPRPSKPTSTCGWRIVPSSR
jgi:hypothetical protein